MKKLLLILCACSAIIFAACGTEQGETTTLKFGLTVSATQPYGIACQNFADAVAELSDGSMQVELYYDGQLGGDRELYESCQVNAIQMTIIGPASICNLIPEYALLDLPCCFETKEAAYALQEGEAGQALLDAAQQSGVGLVALGFYDNGWYQISNDSEPITRLTQLKGLNIRSMQSSLQMNSWDLLQAAPMVIPWNELYLSLQQGLVEAQETTIGSFYSSGFYEAQHYITLSDRLYHVMTMFISETCWNSLSEDQQQIIRTAVEQTAPAHREFNNAETERLLKLLQEEEGVTVSVWEPGEWALMKEASMPLYEQTRKYVGNDELYKLFLREAEAANAAHPRADK